jgi:N-acetylneuraminate lyase
MVFELIAAPHTPLDENGEVNLEQVARQADHLRAAGVDGVLVAGSTGEGPSLTGAERRQLARRWVEVAGRLRVIVHVGHQSPPEARALARHAAESGARAICAAPPNWFPIQSAEALAETCATIAAGAPELPFLYYHIPALSGVHVPMAQLLDLARDRIPSFAGVKYTHLDPLDFQACVREHGGEVQLLWGLDDMLLKGLSLGAHGAVGSSYNFATPLYRRLIAAHARGDSGAARGFQSQSALLVETLGRYGYAAAAKTVMKFVGVDCGPVRAPLSRLDSAAEKALRADLERIGFFDWIREPGPR